jgi:hypothetical protein
MPLSLLPTADQAFSGPCPVVAFAAAHGSLSSFVFEPVTLLSPSPHPHSLTLHPWDLCAPPMPVR